MQVTDTAQIPHCCGCGRRRPAAVAPIRPLAWELSQAEGMTPKREKKKLETLKLVTFLETAALDNQS